MSGFRCEGVSEVQCYISCDNIPLHPASIIPYWYFEIEDLGVEEENSIFSKS